MTLVLLDWTPRATSVFFLFFFKVNERERCSVTALIQRDLMQHFTPSTIAALCLLLVCVLVWLAGRSVLCVPCMFGLFGRRQ